MSYKFFFHPNKSRKDFNNNYDDDDFASTPEEAGLEMTQNSIRLKWTEEEVDKTLKRIMTDIHEACVKYGTEPDGYVNYVKGANIAAFIKVADAMLAQGLV